VPFSLWPPSRTKSPLPSHNGAGHPGTRTSSRIHQTSNLLPFAVLTSLCSARRARVSCPCSYLTSFCLPDALNRGNPPKTPYAFPLCCAVTMDPFDTLSDASSRLTSPASRSPTPPSELDRLYPSPPSSGQSSQESSPAPDDMRTKRSRDDTDDSQPTKKRKMSEPKPRTTEHLDLQSKILKDSEKEQLDKLLKVLHKKRKIVVVAGAGISVSAGSMSPLQCFE